MYIPTPIPRPSSPIPHCTTGYRGKFCFSKGNVFKRTKRPIWPPPQFGHAGGGRSSSRRGVLTVNTGSDTGDIVRVKPFQMTADTTFLMPTDSPCVYNSDRVNSSGNCSKKAAEIIETGQLRYIGRSSQLRRINRAAMRQADIDDGEGGMKVGIAAKSSSTP